MHYKILDVYKNFFYEIFFKFKKKTLNIYKIFICLDYYYFCKLSDSLNFQENIKLIKN